MSILTQDLTQNRLNENGFTVSKEKKFQKVLSVLADSKGGLKTSEIASHLGIRREPTQRDYLKLLLQQGKIKKIEGTDRYQTTEQNYDQNTIRTVILSDSQFMTTNLMTRWQENNHSKNEFRAWTRFANICMGVVNPKFKIHPDTWNKDNFEELTKNSIQAILEGDGKKQMTTFDKMTLRHVIKYGLDINLSKEKAKQLGIEGDKPAPTMSTLHITWEQYEQLRQILKDDDDLFIKFGFCAWTFCRPSVRYTIKLDDLNFYDRKTEYIELGGEKIKDEQELKHIKFLLKFLPQEIQNQFPIVTKTERACQLNIFEFKTKTEFPKRIFDEQLVLKLEKLVRIRKSQRKKYLFWEDNNTEFNFETYNRIVLSQVGNDNKIFLNLLEKIGFKSGDFGKLDRVNYAIRHFGIQLWLQATNYDYAMVSEMSHADIATLRNYYGRMVGQFFDSKLSRVGV